MTLDDESTLTRKRLLGLALVALVLTSSVQAWAAGAVHRFQVDGLACPFCSYGIEKQLKAIPGVKAVSISIKTGTVTVSMAEGEKLTRAQANHAVKAAGFTMRNFK